MHITVIQVSTQEGVSRSLRVWSKEAATDEEGAAIMGYVKSVVGESVADIERITIATTRDIAAL